MRADDPETTSLTTVTVIVLLLTCKAITSTKRSHWLISVMKCNMDFLEIVIVLFFALGQVYCNPSGSLRLNRYVQHGLVMYYLLAGLCAYCVFVNKKSRAYSTKFELCVGYVPSQKGFQHLAIESSTTPEVIHVGGGVGLDAKGKLIIILLL